MPKFNKTKKSHLTNLLEANLHKKEEREVKDSAVHKGQLKRQILLPKN